MLLQEIFWEDFFLLIGKITIFAMMIPIMVAIAKRKDWNTPIKIAFYYCLTTLVISMIVQSFIWLTGAYTELLLPFLDYWKIRNTFFLQILFYLKNFLILGLFYSYVFPLKKIKNHIFFLGKILAFFALINHMFIEGYLIHGVLNPSLNAIFVFIVPLIYLWFSQKHSIRIPFRKNPYFWISLGLFLPKIFGFFLYVSGNYISESNITLFYKLYSTKNLFEIIGQILIAIGFAHSYYARFIKIAE